MTTSTLSFNIRSARAADLAAVRELLGTFDLPADDLPPALDGFLVAEAGGAIAGVIGMERYGAYGLLRSAAVAPAWKGQGLGARLVEQLLDAAMDQGVHEVYLLTETAERWFPRFGFEVVDRALVPESVKRSHEFTTACPASATVMVRR